MSKRKARTGTPREAELGDIASSILKAEAIENWSKILTSPTEHEISETREKLERRQLLA